MGAESQADFEYKTRKQLLMINDLKRYGIQALIVDEFSEITDVLKEIEKRFRKRTVFISGSAEEYGKMSRIEAQALIHNLSKEIISSGFRIVNGFGWGVGSAVINGALDAIYNRPDKYSEEQLIVKPFPQFKTGNKELPELWEEYRQRMQKFAGIAIFIFGNKLSGDNEIIPANGVQREFQIALENELIPIPIAATGFMAEEIYKKIAANPKEYYPNQEWIFPIIEEIAGDNMSNSDIIKKVIKLIKKINK